jgi:hypothetical protein
MRFLLIATMLLSLASATAAASTLTVEGVVSPAWVERGGARMPLAVGMQLSDRDRVVTGGARRGGRHFVTASVSVDQKSALAAYHALRAAGYPAVVRPVKKDDGTLSYPVRVPNLGTPQDAAVTAAKLKALGMPDATVGR